MCPINALFTAIIMILAHPTSKSKKILQILTIIYQILLFFYFLPLDNFIIFFEIDRKFYFWYNNKIHLKDLHEQAKKRIADM